MSDNGNQEMRIQIPQPGELARSMAEKLTEMEKQIIELRRIAKPSRMEKSMLLLLESQSLMLLHEVALLASRQQQADARRQSILKPNLVMPGQFKQGQ